MSLFLTDYPHITTESDIYLTQASRHILEQICVSLYFLIDVEGPGDELLEERDEDGVKRTKNFLTVIKYSAKASWSMLPLKACHCSLAGLPKLGEMMEGFRG